MTVGHQSVSTTLRYINVSHDDALQQIDDYYAKKNQEEEKIQEPAEKEIKRSKPKRKYRKPQKDSHTLLLEQKKRLTKKLEALEDLPPPDIRFMRQKTLGELARFQGRRAK